MFMAIFFFFFYRKELTKAHMHTIKFKRCMISVEVIVQFDTYNILIFSWQMYLYSLTVFFFLSVHLNPFSLLVKEGMCLCVLLFWLLMNAALWNIWNIHSITSLCQNPTLIWHTCWKVCDGMIKSCEKVEKTPHRANILVC